jgi:hypothetical protein
VSVPPPGDQGQMTVIAWKGKRKDPQAARIQ